jgi:hypothetical protein
MQTANDFIVLNICEYLENVDCNSSLNGKPR